jgi:hypothetical protein
LLTAGRSLENDDIGRIFGRMGALSNFAAKIEIAYMFDLIDKAIRDDLRRIKSIRNAFAHTTRYVYFETPQIADQCQKLSNWKPGMDAQESYREKSDRVRKRNKGPDGQADASKGLARRAVSQDR